MVRRTILHQNARGRLPERRSRLPPWAGQRWFPVRQLRLPGAAAVWVAVRDRLPAVGHCTHWTSSGGRTLELDVARGWRPGWEWGAVQEPFGSGLSASAVRRTCCDCVRGWRGRGAELEMGVADPGRRHYPSAGPDLPGMGPLSPGRWLSTPALRGAGSSLLPPVLHGLRLSPGWGTSSLTCPPRAPLNPVPRAPPSGAGSVHPLGGVLTLPFAGSANHPAAVVGHQRFPGRNRCCRRGLAVRQADGYGEAATRAVGPDDVCWRCGVRCEVSARRTAACAAACGCRC